MQSSKLRISSQKIQAPTAPTTIWHQLPTSHQQQLAHLVAQLIQRIRQAALDKEQQHEQQEC